MEETQPAFYKGMLYIWEHGGQSVFRYVDLQTGVEVTAVAGPGNNTYGAVYVLCGNKWPGGEDRQRVMYHRQDVKAREFSRMVKECKGAYVGCNAADIAEYILVKVHETKT